MAVPLSPAGIAPQTERDLQAPEPERPGHVPGPRPARILAAGRRPQPPDGRGSTTNSAWPNTKRSKASCNGGRRKRDNGSRDRIGGSHSPCHCLTAATVGQVPTEIARQPSSSARVGSTGGAALLASRRTGRHFGHRRSRRLPSSGTTGPALGWAELLVKRSAGEYDDKMRRAGWGSLRRPRSFRRTCLGFTFYLILYGSFSPWYARSRSLPRGSCCWASRRFGPMRPSWIRCMATGFIRISAANTVRLMTA